ncbi:MAG TPA: CapA family protein, partial [Phototrophicaceae bacterium]|nr:CapA family protein [Phototrophicaceae bacterium]
VSFVEGCPQLPADPTAPGGFCSKPEYFNVLNQLGVDIVELSGNHNNDYGYDAYRTTLKWYQDNNIRTIAGGETDANARQPLLLEHNGSKVAWLSCNWIGPYYAWVNEDPNKLGGVRPGAADCNRDWLAATIPQLKAENDVVIVTVQYQESDSYLPLPQQRIDFAWLAGLGADVVIGTQAHWPQTYDYAPEPDGEAFIHYGIGNFIFDQPWWANTRFFLDELYIYDGKLQFVEIYPGIIEDLGRPRLMTPEERDEFLYLMFVKNGDF